MIKAVVVRKEAAWKEVLGVGMRLSKKDVWRLTKKIRERLKYQSIKS